jgi:hypothetical protein
MHKSMELLKVDLDKSRTNGRVLCHHDRAQLIETPESIDPVSGLGAALVKEHPQLTDYNHGNVLHDALLLDADLYEHLNSVHLHFFL